MLTTVDVSILADRHTGELDAAVSVWRAQDDGQDESCQVSTIAKKSKPLDVIQSAIGTKLFPIDRALRTPRIENIENTEFIYLAWLSTLNVYKCTVT